jgi:hypothetical protein
MKFWEAVKIWQETGALVRPKKLSKSDFDKPFYWTTDVCEDFSLEWEAEEKKVTITRSDLERAWDKTFPSSVSVLFEKLCTELGL